jgi:hypothetical protein
VGSLVSALSRRFWIAVGAGVTLIILGAALGSAAVRYIGLGLVGGLVLVWVAVAMGEHVRQVREDRRMFPRTFND